MEEDIKIVEDLKNKWELNAFGDMSNVLSLNEIKALENLIKGYRELEESNRIYALNGGNIALELHIKKNYIPKSKIKEKIQELTNMRDTTITSDGYNILNGEIVVLQELMEDK